MLVRWYCCHHLTTCPEQGLQGMEGTDTGSGALAPTPHPGGLPVREPAPLMPEHVHGQSPLSWTAPTPSYTPDHSPASSHATPMSGPTTNAAPMPSNANQQCKHPGPASIHHRKAARLWPDHVEFSHSVSNIGRLLRDLSAIVLWTNSIATRTPKDFLLAH